MLALVGLKIGDGAAELRIVLAQRLELLRIMGVDLVLDRGRAGHRRLRPDQRRGRAERVAGDMPERLEQGRAHAALRHHRVEMLEMPLLLRRHAGDQARGRLAVAEHRELAGIDAGRAIFAGLIDAQHRGGVGARVAGPPAGGGAQSRPGRFRLNHRTINAPARERIAFQPAIEMPRKRPLHLIAAHQRRGQDLLEDVVRGAAADQRRALGEAFEDNRSSTPA